MYGCGKDHLILIPFRLPQISCFTLSLKCFSSDSDNCPDTGIGPLLQFPHPLRAGPVLLILLFSPLVPLSYRVLHGSIYSFPLTRYSCLLSAGVLHALLCLKCIADISIERDVLHVHLLLCHLCTLMFIAALFTISRTWKQPRCPLADDWIRKLWYIYTMECYSVIKRNAFESVLMRWMNLEPITQSKVNQKEKKQIQCINSYMWNLERQYR